jgi:NADPH:quinone reductase-like Zn-dependent oxidoreductase
MSTVSRIRPFGKRCAIVFEAKRIRWVRAARVRDDLVGHVRDADRQGVWSPGDRRLQHGNVDLVTSIGADRVIDYTQDAFAQSGQRYDVMLDLIGSRALSDCRRALTPRGTYVLVGVSDLGRWFGLARQVKVLSLSPLVRQRMRVFFVRHNRKDLVVLKELVETGKITPVIDRRYELSEVPEALRYQGEGHAQRKIVIAVRDV